MTGESMAEPIDRLLMLIDDEPAQCRLIAALAAREGWRTILARDSETAIAMLGTRQGMQLGAIILDQWVPGDEACTLIAELKARRPALPILMLTTSASPLLAVEAMRAGATDYLIKPVNPNQVLLTLKKIIDSRRLVSEATTQAYQQDFRNLFVALTSNPNHEEWKELYRRLVYWELEMARSNSDEMMEVLQSQKSEANTAFFKYVSKNYEKWIKGSVDAPLFSHQLMKAKVAPYLEPGRPTFLIVIDNLRFDQWKAIQPIVNESFRTVEEDLFYSILPTATQYSRNALFAGMLPAEIAKKFPNEWKNDDEEGGKNLHEAHFLKAQMKASHMGDLRTHYIKITNNEDGKSLEDNIHNYLQNDLTVVVYNFVDMLSHARTEMEVLKELASDEVSYRSLTVSWFEHSPLYRALKRIADKDIQVIITTDHGTVRVQKPSKCVGDRQTTTNLRYKHGRNLQYEDRDVLAFRDPSQAGLPRPNVSSTFIFAKEDVFLCYPNNYNHYVNYYRNTFQHGGISLEEMLVPVVRLVSK